MIAVAKPICTTLKYAQATPPSLGRPEIGHHFAEGHAAGLLGGFKVDVLLRQREAVRRRTELFESAMKIPSTREAAFFK